MKRILQIVDSLEYVTTNSFQHQLLKTLQRETDVVTVPIDRLSKTLIDGRIVLICLKLRSVVKHIDLLSKELARIPVYVYDQDVWESFMDEGSYKGSYEMISSRLSVQSFLNTSHWWANYVRSKGLPSEFVKMWVLPEYCQTHSFSSRIIDVGFMGQMHSFRKQTFEELKELDLNVQTFPGGPYEMYLQKLSDMKFFIHYEQDRWHIDGRIIPCNSLYGKTVEVMSRGTFCLRERSDEAVHWNLRDNPLLVEFSSLNELVEQVKTIKSLDPDLVEKWITKGVEMIKNDSGWKTIVEVLK
jgi:hypothetical protein